MGYAVTDTVLSPAASHNLTDLATVKDELSLDASNTSDDSWLTRAIAQVSRAIARHIKRPVAPEVVQDAFDIQQDPYPYQTPGGFAQLQLTRWPVLNVASVVQTLAAGVTQTLQAGLDYRVDFKTGQLLRLNPWTGTATLWEAIPVTVVYTAGYGVIVQEAHTVPAAPYQVTVYQNAAFSCDQSVAYANGAALTPVPANPAQGQYSVAAGVYTFNPADDGQALTFTYATLAVPDDLIEICLRLITGRYSAKDRDPNLVQQDTPGVGSQRWWFGNTPGQKGAFAPDIEAALDDYRTPTMA